MRLIGAVISSSRNSPPSPPIPSQPPGCGLLVLSNFSGSFASVPLEPVNQLWGFISRLCGRQDNGSPKDVHILTPGTCEYVTFCSKKDFADAIKLRICKGEIIPGYPGGPNVIKDPYDREAGGSEPERKL